MTKSPAAALIACMSLSSPAHAAALSAVEREVVRHADAQLEEAIALLQRAVDVPSATENLAGVRENGEIFAAALRPLGFETRWVEMPAEMGRAGHLIATRGGRGPGVLVIGHLDTVLEGERFRREGDRAWGSGTSDMKGGNVVIVAALRALHSAGALEGRAISVILTGDEESTGRPYDVARKPLLDLTPGVKYALAFEGYVPGTAVTGRRGFSSWRLEVRAKQAHSSGIFNAETGSGAVFELARILNAFHETLREPYLTFNPSLAVGGSEAQLDAATSAGTAEGKTNVVADLAFAHGDLRYLSADQLARARARMREIVGKNLPGTSAEIHFEDGMPGMAPTPAGEALLARLDQVSRDLGTGPIAPHDPSKRGAADVSFVPDTIARMDGLGALGDNEHAPGEWIDLREFPNIVKRAALLIHRLAD
jgi:glutamate carboxypeptidase